MTIFKGDTITVTNPTQLQYQVDGDGFGSGTVNPNGTAVTFTFNKLGSFAIFDEWHRNLTGFINVVDPTLTPIIITVPSPITVQSTSSSGTTVIYSVSAIDAVDGSITPVCTPISGSNFVVGTTTVTCTARDSTGNSKTATFTVTVQQQAPLDTIPPIVIPPSNQVVISSNSNGMIVNYPNATATDNVGVTSGPICTPSSGSIFQVGTTTVTCTASDAAGNVGRATFTVTVNVQPTLPQSFTPNITTSIAISSNQVSLSWTPPSQTYGQNINGYRIDQIVNGNFLQIANVAGTVTTYEVPDLIPGNTYTFAIIALLSGGSTTNPSPSVSVTLPSLSTSSVNQITIALGAGASANAACVSTNNCFYPNPLTVAPGTTVTWKNTDNTMHVVCSGKPSDDECGKVFEDDSLIPGKTFQFTFANTGTYDYYCSVHPWMTGQVIVGSGVQPIPTSSSAITATTDKSSYSAGDSIVVSGTVNPINSVNPQLPVTIQTYDIYDVLVRIDQAIPSPNGHFSVTIPAHGSSWQNTGTYTLKIQYDQPSSASQLTFHFNSVTVTPPVGINSQCTMPNMEQDSIHQSTTTDSSSMVVEYRYSPSNPHNGCPIEFRVSFEQNYDYTQKFRNLQYDISIVDNNDHKLYSLALDKGKTALFAPVGDDDNTFVLKGTTPATHFVISALGVGSEGSPPDTSSAGLVRVDVKTQESFGSQYSLGQSINNSISTFTPTGLSATVISPTQINLSWFAPTQNYGKIIVGYKIEQQTNYGVFDTVVYNTNSTLTSHSMTDLKTGVQYTFRVSTIYSDDTSTDPSNSITVIPSAQASGFTPTQQDIDNINQAKANQTIAAEVNIGVNQSTTTIDNNVSVQTTSNTPDSLNVNVSASSQTGPKVIAFNLEATTINVANLKDLGVMYDGKLISPAPNIDAILHAKSTDNPSFAIVVTQSGVQVLVLVPHFSTHSITITNMSKVITAIPEFGPIMGMIITISVVGSMVISRKFT